MTDEHERNNRWIIDKPFRDAHKDIDSNLAGWDYIKKLESEAAQSAEKIARLTEKANEAEKWKGVALAKFGDGRTVQQVETPLLEKIARLEAENASLGAQIDRLNDQCDDWKEQAAAAELSNKQLREAAQGILDSGNEQGTCCCEFCQRARKLLAQQPSTEALDAYVASKVKWVGRCVHGKAMWQADAPESQDLYVMPLPPAPDKDKE